MRSSTFSFDRIPNSRWGPILLIVVVTAASLLVFSELFWRFRGAEPNYVDDPRRWSYFRDQVGPMKERNSTILIGASRIQLGWSLDTFRSIIPRTRIIQLAIDGTHPWAVLRDLSENTDFAGVVIVALTAGGILPGVRNGAQEYIQFHTDSWTPNNEINFLMDDFFQGYLIAR